MFKDCIKCGKSRHPDQLNDSGHCGDCRLAFVTEMRRRDEEAYLLARGEQPPKPLTGPDDPRHGKYTTYQRHKCKCERCRRAEADRAKEWRDRERRAREKRGAR